MGEDSTSAHVSSVVRIEEVEGRKGLCRSWKQQKRSQGRVSRARWEKDRTDTLQWKQGGENGTRGWWEGRGWIVQSSQNQCVEVENNGATGDSGVRR